VSALATLPPVLSVAEVMERYGLRDRRAARGLMDAAGGILAAGRLVVRADDLAAWETAQKAARRSQEPTAKAPRRRAARQVATAPRGEPLKAGWWREATPKK
jgi:hypothetical protein